MRTKLPDIMPRRAVAGNVKFSNAMHLGVLRRSRPSGGDVRVAARLKSASVPILPLGFEHCIRKLHIPDQGVARHYIRQFLVVGGIFGFLVA